MAGELKINSMETDITVSNCYDSFEWLGKIFVKKNVENESLTENDISIKGEVFY